MKVRLVIAGLLVALVVAFIVLHLAGSRQHVQVLSGTLSGSSTELVLGVAYAATWFAVILVVPIMALTMILELAWRRIARMLSAAAERRA